LLKKKYEHISEWNSARFDDLTARSIKVTASCDVTPCGLLDGTKASSSIFRVEEKG
jgi:hypothetical protein